MRTAVITGRYAAPPASMRSATPDHRFDFWGNAFACLIPMLMFLEVKLVGRLFVSEVLLLVALPFLMLSKARKLLEPLPRTVILLSFFWFVGQVFTDLIRDAPFEDYSRGWAKIIFFSTNFMALYLLLRGQPKRWLLFGLGIAVGQILGYVISPNEYAEGQPWKFGVGSAVTILCVLLTQSAVISRIRLLPGSIIGLMGLVNIYFNSRSLGLICLVTAGYLFLLARAKTRGGAAQSHGKTARWPQTIAALGIFIAVGAAVQWGYGYAAGSGWLGEDAEVKYRAQGAGDLGLLLGGRTEILASSQAIIDSPIIGHGSWAKNADYVDLAEYRYAQLGYESLGVSESELIPTHSHLFGTWVEAGIVGAIFWGWVFLQAMRLLFSPGLRHFKYAGWVFFLTLSLLWSILFSPFGASQRMYAAFDIVVILLVLTDLRRKSGYARGRGAGI